MDAMETKLFRKLDDDEKNDEFIAVESRTFLQSATLASSSPNAGAI